jgi:hypothetical protein
MIKVEPIRPEERPRCQYCGKPMHPRHPEQREFKSEAELEAFSTNRRVYAIRRRWNDKLDHRFEPTGERVLNHIEVSFFPTDKTRWGADGIFCSGDHARSFAYAAIRAGYRIKR